jgi:alpha-glucosidase
MRLWADGDKPDAPVLTERRVVEGEALTLDLAAHGGAAAIFEK